MPCYAAPPWAHRFSADTTTCPSTRQSCSAPPGCGSWPVDGAIAASGSPPYSASRCAAWSARCRPYPPSSTAAKRSAGPARREPQRWGDRIPYSVHAEYSLGSRSIPGMLVPGLALHANSYIGVVALGLALTAVWFRRGATIRVHRGLRFLLALGKDTPVHWLAYRFIPLVEKARYPAMAIVLSQVGIAALVAQALSLPKELLRKSCLPVRDRRRRRPGLYFTLDHPAGHPAWVVAAVALADGRSPAMGPSVTRRRPRPIPRRMCDLPATDHPAPRDSRGRTPVSSNRSPTSRISSNGSPAGFASISTRRSCPTTSGISMASSSLSGTLRRCRCASTGRSGRNRRRASTACSTGSRRRRPIRRKSRSFSLVAASRCSAIPESASLYGSIGTRLVHIPTACGSSAAMPNASVFEADLGCPGWLVSGDPWYRGWRAQVDGRRVPIQEFEGGVRAVKVGAGIHRIEHIYRPNSVYFGVGL